METAVYPGSFDPVTNGHLDIITRAAQRYDEVVVCLFTNVRKHFLFTVAERVALLEEAVGHLPGVRVETHSGLLVDYMHEKGYTTIIKGLRNVADFEYEMSMAYYNNRLRPEVETFFLPAADEYRYLSSSSVKEVATFGGAIDDFVPAHVRDAIWKKLGKEEANEGIRTTN